MSRKTSALYVKLFEMLKVLVSQFTPASVMVDFEEATVSPFRLDFSQSVVLTFKRCLIFTSGVVPK